MKMGWVSVVWGHALSVIIGISRAYLIYNFPCTITLHIMSINWAKVGGARPLVSKVGGAMASPAPPIPNPLHAASKFCAGASEL